MRNILITPSKEIYLAISQVINLFDLMDCWLLLQKISKGEHINTDRTIYMVDSICNMQDAARSFIEDNIRVYGLRHNGWFTLQHLIIPFQQGLWFDWTTMSLISELHGLKSSFINSSNSTNEWTTKAKNMLYVFDEQDEKDLQGLTLLQKQFTKTKKDIEQVYIIEEYGRLESVLESRLRLKWIHR